MCVIFTHIKCIRVQCSSKAYTFVFTVFQYSILFLHEDFFIFCYFRPHITQDDVHLIYLKVHTSILLFFVDEQMEKNLIHFL